MADRVEIAHVTRTGRVRVSVPALRRDGALCARVGTVLQSHADVFRAEARATTGSVILHLHAVLPEADVIRMIRAALGQAKAGSAVPSVHPSRDETRWHSLSVERIAHDLKTDATRGLSVEEAAARLHRHGRNVLPQDEPDSRVHLFAKQFESLPVAMLGGSAVVSLLTGGVADAAATLSVVLINAAFGYATEGQAEVAIHALMDRSRQNVPVLRDGREAMIAAADVVPGDLLCVRPGVQIVADARVSAAVNLRADESALTGETFPVAKTMRAQVSGEAPIGERPTMLHAGTLVSEGTGRAIVTATGRNSAVARIALLSQSAARPQAPVEAELGRLGDRLALVSVAACAVFFGIGWMRGVPFREILKDALALAVAAVPEGLPVVATTTMSLGLRRMERKGILIRRMDTVETLGAVQILCLDKTGTLTRNRMQVVRAFGGLEGDGETHPDVLKRLAEAAALNNDVLPEALADPAASQTEAALMRFALDEGVDVAALRATAPRVRTIERLPGRPWMATLHGGGAGVIAKGAPEVLLARCTWIRDGATRRRLSDADRNRLLRANDALAARPARVLGFAGCDEAEGDDLTGLTWLGLVGFIDPLRDGARRFVQRMHRAGLRTIMITGDQAATAAAMARELDLSDGGPLRIIDSPEISAMDPALLGGVARHTHVFSRVSAQHKLAIIKALQNDGAVVAMTGDGVNDGPALKAADVGIAMGASGSDLARDVANVVIRDDKLSTLVEAIEQGRAVYRNIRQALEFLVTTNLSEIVVGLVESIHGPGELETPMELLWINLVGDVLPGLGLALADPDPDAMARPPRPKGEPIIPRADTRRMVQDSALIAGATLVSHFVGLARYGPGPQTRSMTFLSLSLGQLLYTLTCQRTDIRKLDPGNLLENRSLDAALLVSGGLAVLPFFVPGLRRLLGIAPLSPGSAMVALAAAAAPAGAVLARRGLVLEIRDVEGHPCETSS